MNKIKKLYKSLSNNEIVTYAIAGLLTTLVNYASYYILCDILLFTNLIANAIAWVIAVSFAYVINNSFVFKSKSSTFIKEVKKISKFFAARFISFIFEEIGMYIFIDLQGYNNKIVKIILMLIVIIINYFFSKLYIFNKKSYDLESKKV